ETAATARPAWTSTRGKYASPPPRPSRARPPWAERRSNRHSRVSAGARGRRRASAPRSPARAPFRRLVQEVAHFGAPRLRQEVTDADVLIARVPAAHAGVLTAVRKGALGLVFGACARLLDGFDAVALFIGAG